MTNVTQNKDVIGNHDAYVVEGIVPWKVGGGVYPLQFKEVLISAQNNFYTINYYNDKNYFKNYIDTFEKSLDSFKLDSEGGGCLIATATYGSELAPQVQQLRELRDNTLLTSKSGTAFMTAFNQVYYSFSPTIADMERENPMFKETVKIALTPMLTSLSALNHVDIESEQEMLGYGIGVILMNIGMYFVAPAIIVYGIKR
jgi:peptidyl-prolyl cis-trans isomerase B (cyclophilin B)